MGTRYRPSPGLDRQIMIENQTTTRRRAPERATIDPPPEQAHHPYHWAYNCRSPGGFLVYEARGGKLWHSLGHSLNAETLYEKGWRYLAPAIPPTVGSK
jgi:hypothetical protein